MKPRNDRPRTRAAGPTRRVGTPPEPARRRRAPRIRVVVAESRAIDRQALAILLASEKDFEVVGQASSSTEAIERCASLRPAVLVLALDLPDESGEAALPMIRVALPGLRVLAISERGVADCLVLNPPGRERLSARFQLRRCDGDTDCLQLAMAQGALGTLRRSAGPEALFRAVRAVAAGQTAFEPRSGLTFGPDGMGAGAGGRFGLSPRELDVAMLLAEGRSNRDVAHALAISEPTVKKHVGRILTKLNVQDRLQAGLFVARHPLLFSRRARG
jgi:DNA-binding NarL/FixJ family response regulator